MTQAAKMQEPSMEEILASIRRIIADDDAKPSPSASPASPAPIPPAPVAPPPRQAAPLPPPPAMAPPLPSAPAVPLNQDAVDVMMAKDVAPVQPNTVGNEPADILDLTESMVAPAPAAPTTSNFQTIDGEPDVIFSDPDPTPQSSAATVSAEAPQPAPPERPLLSNATSAAVDSAFHSLAHTVLVQNARTLEDLVREMLRPLLKSWLDDNLPGIVERLVKTEIERVSRGRG